MEVWSPLRTNRNRASTADGFPNKSSKWSNALWTRRWKKAKAMHYHESSVRCAGGEKTVVSPTRNSVKNFLCSAVFLWFAPYIIR